MAAPGCPGQTDPLHIFDFFGLPRELRDICYDYILTGETSPIAIQRNELLVYGRYVPRTSALLVNKQFGHESNSNHTFLPTR